MQGVVAGYPLLEIKVTLLMVHSMMLILMKWHLNCGFNGFRDGAAEATPVLLEP